MSVAEKQPSFPKRRVELFAKLHSVVQIDEEIIDILVATFDSKVLGAHFHRRLFDGGCRHAIDDAPKSNDIADATLLRSLGVPAPSDGELAFDFHLDGRREGPYGEIRSKRRHCIDAFGEDELATLRRPLMNQAKGA